ncbi:MAG: hypothetical protein HGA85_02840 [Nanoarchaeota archaeon]|nr:hypothetical protein [Nanoarchaeota archaeon]
MHIDRIYLQSPTNIYAYAFCAAINRFADRDSWDKLAVKYLDSFLTADAQIPLDIPRPYMENVTEEGKPIWLMPTGIKEVNNMPDWALPPTIKYEDGWLNIQYFGPSEGIGYNSFCNLVKGCVNALPEGLREYVNTVLIDPALDTYYARVDPKEGVNLAAVTFFGGHIANEVAKYFTRFLDLDLQQKSHKTMSLGTCAIEDQQKNEKLDFYCRNSFLEDRMVEVLKKDK